MLRILSTLLVVCTLASVETVLAQSKFAGLDWNGWSRDARTMYLVGHVDGQSEGVFDALRIIDAKRWGKVVREGVEKDPQLKALQSNVTVGQLLAGVDKLFEDHRNLHITVRTAVSIVSDEANGDLVVTDEYLQAIRKIEAHDKRN